MAVHAALEVARGIDDPEAMIAVVLPDGGRAYLSKIFNDTWMASHGMLERTSDRTVGDVLAPSRPRARSRRSSWWRRARRSRTRSRCCTSTASRSCRWSRTRTSSTVVGSIGERGLLKHAADNPAIMGTDIVDVMEPPFPAVAAADPVREAVELLSGDRQALLVTADGRPAGIVTRADLLEALVT